jgi:hypothetical protein
LRSAENPEQKPKVSRNHRDGRGGRVERVAERHRPRRRSIRARAEGIGIRLGRLRWRLIETRQTPAGRRTETAGESSGILGTGNGSMIVLRAGRVNIGNLVTEESVALVRARRPRTEPAGDDDSAEMHSAGGRYRAAVGMLLAPSRRRVRPACEFRMCGGPPPTLPGRKVKPVACGFVTGSYSRIATHPITPGVLANVGVPAAVAPDRTTDGPPALRIKIQQEESRRCGTVERSPVVARPWRRCTFPRDSSIVD